MKVFDIQIPDNILEIMKNEPVRERGNFSISLTSPPPSVNIDIAANAKYIEINEQLKADFWFSLKNSIHYDTIKYSNCIAYPPKGGMDWHTNGNDPGMRIYVSWSENGDSGMMWYKNNQILIDKDSPGFNIRQFLTPCWHGVWSNCYRYSMGFKLNI
jgi:hypothetical protein